MKIKPNIEPMKPYTPGKRAPGGIKLSSNENPLGPSPAAIDALRAASESIHIYPDQLGEPLLQRLADTLELDPSRLIIGNGSDELMVLACAAYLDRGENSICARHTFSQYEYATRLFSAEYRPVSMRDYRFDADAIVSAVDESTRVVWLCNPNNPTGTAMPPAEIDRILRSLDPAILVILDEAYHDYVDDDELRLETRRLVDRYPNLLALRTFSKIYGLAALRVGYGFGSAEVIEGMRRVKQPFNVNGPAIAAAHAALGDRGHYERSLEVNCTGKRRLYERFAALDVEYLETQANFVTIRLPFNATPFAAQMLDEGVAVRPLASFGLPDWVRVTVGTNEQLGRFFEAFEPALERTRRRRGAARDGT